MEKEKFIENNRQIRETLTSIGFTTTDPLCDIYVLKKNGKKITFSVEDKKLRKYKTQDTHSFLETIKIWKIEDIKKEVDNFIGL